MITLLAAALLCAGDPQKMEWTVDGVARDGVVYEPTKESPGGPSLVFGFHGHGGSKMNAARTFKIHELWPEAVVVYLQGLPTPGHITDPEGKLAGWQRTPGDQGDRDFKFFDAVLATMKEKYKVDSKRIYCTGHSNGGAFTYLLWANRPEVTWSTWSGPATARHCGSGSACAWSSTMPMRHLAAYRDAIPKTENRALRFPLFGSAIG